MDERYHTNKVRTNRMKVSCTLFTAMIALMLVLISHHGSVYAEKLYSAIVVVDTTLNVRSEPSLTANIIGSLQGGDEIDIFREKDGWAEIQYENTVAWINTDYIKKNNSQSVAKDTSVNTSADVESIVVPVDELISRAYEMEKKSSENKPNAGEEGRSETSADDAHSADSTTAANTGSVSKDDMEQITKDRVTVEQAASGVPELGYVTADALRMREEPNLSGKIITLLLFNTSVQIKDETDDGWLKVLAPDGRTGWVSAEFVERTSKTSANPSTGSSETKGTVDTSLKGKRIMIDPGHGGKDSGTIGVKHGTYEKHLTLSTSLIIASMLRDAGAEVIMTRSNDTHLELSDRANISNKEKPDVFISVHYDYGTKTSSGIISFYYSDSRDKLFANTIQKHLTASTGMKDNGIRKGNFYVLRENTRPSILLELGYVSNPDEEELVRTREYQEKVALGVVNGLRAYFGK